MFVTSGLDGGTDVVFLILVEPVLEALNSFMGVMSWNLELWERFGISSLIEVGDVDEMP